MLIQLPNGDWVRPEEVQMVLAKPHHFKVSITEMYVNWEVHIKHFGATMINAGEDGQSMNMKEAQNLRDQIAEQVNRALHKGGKE